MPEPSTSSTLLAIISHPRDNENIARHWWSYKMTGFTILGCGTEDGKCEWPEPVMRLDTGKMGVRQTPAGSVIWGLAQQELDIYQYFLDHRDFDSVCIIESDGLFVRKPPACHPGGPYLVGLVPNFSRPGLFKTSTYFQTPRWSDRQTTEKLLRYGLEMILANDAEYHVSDRFPAWIAYKHKIDFMPFPAWTPFAFPNWAGLTPEAHALRDIKVAVKSGVIYLHSIKTPAALTAATEAMRECGLIT